MAYQRWWKTVRDQQGNAVNGASVSVYEGGTATLALVYDPNSDDSSPSNLSNPFTTTANGVFGFMAADGEYDVQISGGNGATQQYRVTLNGANLSIYADLAATTGAGLVGYDLAALDSVPTTLGEVQARTVSVFDFMSASQKADVVSGSATIDCSAAFASAVTQCNTMTKAHLVVPRGKYRLESAVEFSLPDYSTVEIYGSFISTVSSGSAIRIGSASRNSLGLYVYGLDVSRATLDTSLGTVGVEIRDVAFGDFRIEAVVGFNTGVQLNSTQANGGTSYCKFNMGAISDCLTSLHLTASASGYTNENTFYGGRFQHSSSFPAVASVHLLIDHFAGSVLNNNRFYSPSFEDRSTLAVAATISGTNNCIFHPRMERSVSQTTYLIEFTVNSLECSVVGKGYTIRDSNISNLGANNEYDTRDSHRMSTQAATTTPVLQVQSSASTTAHSLSVINAAATETFYVEGGGVISTAQYLYAETGLRFSTTSGTKTDRGVFAGTGAPEAAVTASPGSGYFNKSGGTTTTFYFKSTGTGNTGWRTGFERPFVTSKAFTANGATTTFTYPANTGFQYITTSAASLATTLPATSADLDGMVIVFVAGSAVATATWVAGTGGATIVGAPAALVANSPVRMIYHHATTSWYPY